MIVGRDRGRRGGGQMHRALRPVSICVLWLVLTANYCTDTYSEGPRWVDRSESVVYRVFMQPHDNYSDAQVYLVGEFPKTWSFTDSWYTGSIGGVQVSGQGTLLPADPGVCGEMGPVPDDYQRVFLTDGPFPSLSPDTSDHAEAHLRFSTGSTDGTYDLRFWAHVVDAGGEDCDDGDPLSILQSESPEWEQVVGATLPLGFGDHNANVDDIVQFDESVFVEVTGSEAQVWRSSDLLSWESSFAWTWLPGSLESPIFSQPAVAGNRLFIGLSDWEYASPPGACRVWSTSDGVNWELSLEEAPPCRLQTLFEFQGTVYAVVTSPTRLLGSLDGSTWATVADFPADAYWVHATQLFLGAMYLGGENTEPWGGGLWRFNGTEISSVGQALDSCGIAFSMATFRDELYVGCHGIVGEVWSTPDGETWQRVVDDGFGGGGAGNRRVAGLAAHGGRLFAWSDNWPGSGNLWSTNNLVDWEGSLLSQVIREEGLTDLRVSGPHLLASSGGSLWRLRPLFADGFESGDLAAWSSATP